MPRTVRRDQLVDWSAAVWAGLLAGVAFAVLQFIVVPMALGTSGWVFVRYHASVLLGEGVLAPPATPDAGLLAVALLTLLVLSVLYAMLLAYLVHEGGLITGVLGGALFGLALYGVNFWTFTLVRPWFFAIRGAPLLWSHVAFGALAGAIYEALEVEEYAPVETPPDTTGATS